MPTDDKKCRLLVQAIKNPHLEDFWVPRRIELYFHFLNLPPDLTVVVELVVSLIPLLFTQ